MAAAFDGTEMTAMAMEAIGEPSADTGDLAPLTSERRKRVVLAHGRHLRIFNCHL